MIVVLGYGEQGKCNVIDLAGVTEVEKLQMGLHEYAQRVGKVAIRAAGIAPGITSSFISYYDRKEDVIGLRIFCGGFPKFPSYPLGYVRVFNESGVIKEYSGVADEIEDGCLIRIPTLSDREFIYINGFGMMESDVTSGGLSTSLETVKNLDYCSYRTLRFPGHFNYVKSSILNQPDPIGTLSKIIDPVSANNPDIIALHIEIETEEGFETLEYFWEYDYDNNISAMAQATGYIAAEVALQTKLVKPGVFNMDIFDPFAIRQEVLKVRSEKNFDDKPISF
jgi:lysine 6-dehydrogenase